METKNSKSEKKKEFILQKAKEQFIQNGYNNTSMQDLVTYIGVSKGSIYYYFSGKEALFFEIYKENTLQWIDEWKKVEKTTSSFEDKIQKLTEHFVSSYGNPLKKISEEFLLGRQDVNDEFFVKMVNLVREPQKLYDQTFEEGISSGALPAGDAKEWAAIYAALMDGLATLHFEKDLTEVKKIYQRSVSYLIAGIKAEA
ncbi:TetR/AcrR family transcriptional regulator [Enterococcus sp. AZ103]|uniref:TetR/AcrR family transcriptional regulator n=1 Tax=Enterococcus sp. AZ103 TaxID=2774628 RepID=UPI003F241EBB